MEGAGGQPFLEVAIEPRANSRPICSGCGKKRPGYDKLAARRFDFVPLWNMAVFFVYAMRRVDCPDCDVTVERVPWAEGKGHLTVARVQRPVDGQSGFHDRPRGDAVHGVGVSARTVKPGGG